MKSILPAALAGAAILAAALAGCGSTAGSSTYGAPKAPVASPAGAAATSGTDVATATNPLGTIVVDGKGMTAYVFDKDKAGSGKSACTGACAATWPAITSATATPTMTGLTAKVATIPATGGRFQITVNGMPIYTFANDTAAGSTAGQGIGKIWWVIDPSGKQITSAPSKY